MNVALWIAQGLLAATYLMVGSMKVFQPTKVRENLGITWAHGRPDQYIRFVGTTEVLAREGFILPLVTGILPWLTVLAGIGLTLVQLLAIFTEHLPKKEYKVIPLNIVLCRSQSLWSLGAGYFSHRTSKSQEKKGVQMKTNLEKSLLAGIGLLSMTREKAQKIVNDLSIQGGLEKDQGEKWVDQLTHRGEEERQAFRKIIRDEVKTVLDDLGVATKEDLQELATKENHQA